VSILRIRIPVLAIACMSLAAADSPVDIYYKSQASADTDLARFDHENPSCELWTNWQKMCSRLSGPNATYCAVAHKYRARPSEPFCLNMAVTGIAITTTEKAIVSRNRFCRRFRFENIVRANGETMWSGTVCAEYAKNRPFNGYSLVDRRHPACDHWNIHQSGIWYCSKWHDLSCSPIDGVPQNYLRPEDEISIPFKFNPNSAPAYGVMCESRKFKRSQ
jgi:hypothetical protein